jgi:Major Facilitator Superfamily
VSEALPEASQPPADAISLLNRSEFLRFFAALVTSRLGDAFNYIALMWLALEAGGPLAVIAVRLADSIPALVFGFHGGMVADRLPRVRTMIGADVVRAVVLLPLAAIGLAGDVPLELLVGAAFVLAAASSYFEPAAGALVPTLVGRANVQQANGLVQSSAAAVQVMGWALAAALLAVVPLAAFFALDAASFAISALLLLGIRARSRSATAAEDVGHAREGISALRPRPLLAAAVIALGVAITISSGTWIAGVPELVRSELGRGAGSFSLVAAAYAAGVIAVGAALARRPVRRKARASLLAWGIYLPAYLCFALADAVWPALLGGFLAGTGQGAAIVLLTSAAQEEVPDRVLGRVMGLISLVHRGAHATGLLFVAPFFAVAEPQAVFAAAAFAIPLSSLAAAVAARALARRRSPRS